MNFNLKYLTALSILFTTTSYGYIPDLFGAYQQGAEMARQQNAQDAYYQAQMQPRLYVEVYEQGKQKPKRNMQVSPKKGDQLCWSLYPLSNGNQYKSGEKFTLPYAVSVGFPFFGQSPDVYGKIYNGGQMTAQTYGFNRYMVSNGNQIGACWVFNPAPNTTPKGKHFLSIQVGQTIFQDVAFYIVD